MRVVWALATELLLIRVEFVQLNFILISENKFKDDDGVTKSSIFTSGIS